MKLGLNIDHVATLREARKEGIPSVVEAAIEAQRERIERLEADARRYQGIRRAYFAGDMGFADRMNDLDADATWDEFDASIDAALEEKS